MSTLTTRPIKSRGTGEQHWRTDYLGQPGDGTLKNEPQAFLIEMQANETIMPHFHEVDQYQVFVSGNGSVGRSPHVSEPFTMIQPVNSGLMKGLPWISTLAMFAGSLVSVMS